jgi:UDP-N-acetyl-D-galactosamine dehydrogenase
MKNYKICIIGLGYVGLPLAHAFSEKYEVVGFDINATRIETLEQLIEWNNGIKPNKIVDTRDWGNVYY